MIKNLLLAAAAVASLGASIAASAQDRMDVRHDRMEMRHDRRDFRHDRRMMRHDHREMRGRYFSNGRYYHHRFRQHGRWMYR
ncbi:hypothetical protein KZX46_06155 [Polymorphobacter sp. PAMC 29334]|uniref:hypothetical protein n=1 Tax=Polymorphobacter sp. PAMC 29334 TaxID=2862331 RepID=UPI001C76FD70|nr:hypothetical protein [Polymorphobacter sp. PAMC 29334]QYE35554.1 hypothetical protein KZX46_06155 [Polymorphobacter sp. PAMC 29334]